MQAEIRAKLLAADRESPELEYPKEWTAELRKENLAEIAAFMQAVNERYGVESDWDISVQDASYFCSVMFTLNEVHYDIRFSHFGKLATAINWTTEERESTVEELEQLIADYGFFPVPYEALQERYEGKGSRAFKTWFDRFFDYL